MIQSLTGLIHTIAAVTAMISGVVVFLRPKAGAIHRRLGYIYSVAMVVLIVTALCIYHLTRGRNVLHLFALVSIPPLARGLSAAIFRRPAGQWLRAHYLGMAFSYLGLLSAFAAEMGTRVFVPYLSHHYGLRSPLVFWVLVGGASTMIGAFGSALILRNQARLMRLQPA